MKSAWKTIGIYPYNPDIIPLNKLALSETSTTQLTAANAIHSTPVHKIMLVFSYFNTSLKWGSNSNNKDKDEDDNGESDNKNNGKDGESDDENDGENDSKNDSKNDGKNSSKNNSESNNENNNENNDENNGKNSSKNDEDDDTNNPFLPSFTPRSCMHILQKSFSSNLSTLYLVSKEPVNSSLNLIKPIHEKPYFIQELDWSLI